MANEERNALAELESELRFTLTDIQGECCEASYEAVAKASRILAELAKVMWYKAENGEVPFYPTGIGDIIWKCRAIAAKDEEIAKLKFDNMRLISELRTAGEVIIEQTNKVEARDAEIAKLRALVKELADVAEGFVLCKATDCETVCRGDERCLHSRTIALVAKAREVVK